MIYSGNLHAHYVAYSELEDLKAVEQNFLVIFEQLLHAIKKQLLLVYVLHRENQNYPSEVVLNGLKDWRENVLNEHTVVTIWCELEDVKQP